MTPGKRMSHHHNRPRAYTISVSGRDGKFFLKPRKGDSKSWYRRLRDHAGGVKRIPAKWSWGEWPRKEREAPARFDPYAGTETR